MLHLYHRDMSDNLITYLQKLSTISEICQRQQTLSTYFHTSCKSDFIWRQYRHWLTAERSLENICLMTSSNGNIFRVTGHLCGEFTGHGWIPHTKASDAELWCFFICAWINGWVNNREAGDLRRHRVHYDVMVMPPICTTQLCYVSLSGSPYANMD